MDLPLAPVRIKVRGTPGCALLKHVESVDPRVAEGLKREPALNQHRKSTKNGSHATTASSAAAQASAMSQEDLEQLVEEEKRRAITDPFQVFLYDARAMHKRGNFKALQGEVILSRIRDILDKGAADLNLAGFVLYDDFCTELLAPYLRAKTCRLAAVNVSGTQIGAIGAMALARAANPLLQTLQLSSEHPLPVLALRREAQSSHTVVLSSRRFSHLDAAALGVLVEREREVERLDVSENELTGSRTNAFHGVATLFHGLKRCTRLRELNLHCVGLRSEGLVSLANAVADYRALEKLVLSRNQIASNGFGEASASGVEALCRAVWQTKKLVTLVLADNDLDYLSCIPVAKMLAETHTLATLDVSRNPIGDAGAVHLASGIKKNASLRSLSLFACQLGSEAFRELATSLRKFNRTLQSIDLRENPDARSAGYRDLAKCLAVNPSLSHVELSPPSSLSSSSSSSLPSSSKYAKHVQRVRDYVCVNMALQTLRRGFADFRFAHLSDSQRTNFVEKLNDLSELELQALYEMHVMETAQVAADDTRATAAESEHTTFALESSGSYSNLRMYATLARAAPLKRLLWVLAAGERQAHLQERHARLRATGAPKQTKQLIRGRSGGGVGGKDVGGKDVGGGDGDEGDDGEDDDDVWDYPLC